MSVYGMGTMGFTTPNIDRIGMEGIRLTVLYAQPSCTAGRVAIITGQMLHIMVEPATQIEVPKMVIELSA